MGGGALLARVFRVEHDRGLGKLAHVRVFSGSIEPRQSVYLPRCGTTLLEPILRVRAVFDPTLAGRVIGLLQGMRGVLLEQGVRGEKQVLNAEVPAAESMELPVEFAKLTGGRGSISTVFSHYALCPPGFTAERERIGANPLDRAKYILEKRNALTAG